MYDPVAAKAEAERKKKEAAQKAETERMLLIKLVRKHSDKMKVYWSLSSRLDQNYLADGPFKNWIQFSIKLSRYPEFVIRL